MYIKYAQLTSKNDSAKKFFNLFSNLKNLNFFESVLVRKVPQTGFNENSRFQLRLK